ncbi:MAG: LacI family DNA-binding transcriptional regulator [Pseudomonadota bacterium]
MAHRRRDRRGHHPPTMHDVARLAGVSQMTVSRVMRQTNYISQDVKKEVERAARELGYVHNRLAGGIADYDNPLVGVVVPTLQNRVFTEALSGISDVLGERGLRPVFGVSEYSLESEEDLVFDLLSWRPRGLILPGLEHSPSVRQIIARTGVRVAEIMDIDGEPIAASFGFSHRGAGADMAQHLIERGYRTFGYVASHGGRDLRAEKRHDAFAAGIAAAGAQLLASRIASEPSSMVVGRTLTAELLSGPAQPDAIYYANDDLAAGGLMHCMASGISVPSDLAIAGFNGLAFLSALPMRITTTETPRYEIGAEAARWLADAKDGAPEARNLGSRIRPGDTT